MQTECIERTFVFQPLDRRDVVGKFDGGTITSDAGALLLREVDRGTSIIQKFAACFTDFRNPDLIEHELTGLIAQRVYGLALGYEDLNDHDELRKDPLLATLAGKADPTGQNREQKRDRGKPLAGKSTLNRLELTPEGANRKSRYKKIVIRPEAVDDFLVDVDANVAYVTTHRENTIVKVDLATGVNTTIAGGPFHSDMIGLTSGAWDRGMDWEGNRHILRLMEGSRIRTTELSERRRF